MIEPSKGVLDGVYARCIGSRRPAHHNDLNAECARCGDLAMGRAAAAVLRYEDFDLVMRHERTVAGFAERAARRDVCHVRQRQRRIHRIDAADQIMVLRCCRERRELFAADGDKHVSALLSDGVNRRPHVADFGPAISSHGTPWRPAKRHKLHRGFARRCRSAVRNDICVGMRSIDQRVDSLRREMMSQALRTAETAYADRHRMCNRQRGAACERQSHVKAAALSKPFGQLPCFRRTAEDKDFRHAVS